MRCENDIVEEKEWMVGKRRLLFEHVQSGAGDLPRLQCVQEILFTHQASPSGINEKRSWLHQSQRSLIDQMPRFPSQRHVQSQIIGFGQQAVERQQSDFVLNHKSLVRKRFMSDE